MQYLFLLFISYSLELFAVCAGRQIAMLKSHWYTGDQMTLRKNTGKSDDILVREVDRLIYHWFSNRDKEGRQW